MIITNKCFGHNGEVRIPCEECENTKVFEIQVGEIFTQQKADELKEYLALLESQISGPHVKKSGTLLRFCLSLDNQSNIKNE